MNLGDSRLSLSTGSVRPSSKKKKEMMKEIRTKVVEQRLDTQVRYRTENELGIGLRILLIESICMT